MSDELISAAVQIRLANDTRDMLAAIRDLLADNSTENTQDRLANILVKHMEATAEINQQLITLHAKLTRLLAQPKAPLPVNLKLDQQAASVTVRQERALPKKLRVTKRDENDCIMEAIIEPL